MIKYITIAVFLLVAVTHAIQPGRIVAPGVTGMNTDTDAADLRLTDARYLLNVDVTSEPGVWKRRAGHIDYGGDTAMSGAVALYDPITKAKGAAYVVPALTVGVTGYKSDLSGTWTTVDSTWTLGSGDTIGQIAFTAANQTTVDAIVNWWGKYGAVHDFEPIPDGVVFSNQSAPVGLLSLIESFATTDTIFDTAIVLGETDTTTIRYLDEDTKEWVTDTTITVLNEDTVSILIFKAIVDTVGFLATIQSLSPESPGSVRAFALDSIGTGELTGTFEYAVAPMDADTSWPAVIYVGDTRAVTVKNGGVLLHRFPRSPVISGIDLFHLIIRRNLTVGGPWTIIDTIAFQRGDEVVYIDTITTPDTIVYIDTTSAIRLVGGDSPGQLKVVTSDTAGNCASQLRFVGHDTVTQITPADAWDRATNYLFAYSFLDTLHNIESPLGVVTHVVSADTIAGNLQIPSVLTYSWVGSYHAVRLYRTESIDSITDEIRKNPFDEAIFYAVQDIKLDGWAGQGRVKVGLISDTALVGGSVSPVDETGSVITRAPLITGLVSSMRDVVEWNDRLWGVGDQEFPSRLWYTADTEYENWPGLSFLDLDEFDNDICIAVEKISVGNAKALLVFKRNKTFIIYGSPPSDVEFLNNSLWGSFGEVSGLDQIGDLTVSILAHNTGAISKDLVIGTGDAVYIVTNDLEVVKFTGTRFDTISHGVLEQIKHAMTSTTVVPQGGGRERPASATSYSASQVNSRAMLHGDKVVYINELADLGMSYNMRSGLWQAIDFNFTAIPWGTFKYDTIANREIFGDDNDLFFFKGVQGLPFALEADSLFFDSGTALGYISQYRSPTFTNEGQYVYMKSVNINYSTSGAGPLVTLRVISPTNDTLATSTFTATSGDTDKRIGFSRHSASGVFLEISIAATGFDFKIYDIQPDIAVVGRKRIE